MKISQTKYQIYNVGRKLYCSPTILYSRFIVSSYAELSRVGDGFELETAINLIGNLRKKFPNNTYELHKVTTIIEPIPIRVFTRVGAGNLLVGQGDGVPIDARKDENSPWYQVLVVREGRNPDELADELEHDTNKRLKLIEIAEDILRRSYPQKSAT